MAQSNLDPLKIHESNENSNTICENADFNTINSVLVDSSDNQYSIANNEIQMHVPNQPLNGDNTAISTHSTYYPHDTSTYSSYINNYDQFYHTPGTAGIDFRDIASGIVHTSQGRIPYQPGISLHDYQLMMSSRFYPHFDNNGFNVANECTSFMSTNNMTNLQERKLATFDGYCPSNGHSSSSKILFDNQADSVPMQITSTNMQTDLPSTTCNTNSELIKQEYQNQIDERNIYKDGASNSLEILPKISSNYVSQIKEEQTTDILDLDSHKMLYSLCLPVQKEKDDTHHNGKTNMVISSAVHQSSLNLWNDEINRYKVTPLEKQQHLLKKKFDDGKSGITRSLSNSFPAEENQFDIGIKLNDVNTVIASPVLTSTPVDQQYEQYELPSSSLQECASSVRAASWKSNEARRPKTYNCTACNKWFTSSGHLKRHYNTTLHKNAVKSSGQPDPASLPISTHHHPHRDLCVKNSRSDRITDAKYQKCENFSDNHPNGLAGSSDYPSEQRGLLKTPNQVSSIMEQEEEDLFYKNQHQILEKQLGTITSFRNLHKQQNLKQDFHIPNILKDFRSTSNQCTGAAPNYMISNQYQKTTQQHIYNHLSTPRDIILAMPKTTIHNMVKHQYIVSPLAINTNTIVNQAAQNQASIPIQSLCPRLQISGNSQASFHITSGNNEIKNEISNKLLQFGTIDSSQQEKKDQMKIQSLTNMKQNSQELVKNNHINFNDANALKLKPTTSAVFLEEPNKFLPYSQHSPQEADVPSQHLTLSAKLPEPTTVRQGNRASPTISSSTVDRKFYGQGVTSKVAKKTGRTFRTTAMDVIRCEECNKVFTKICYLTQHNKTFHSGEQPYRCQQCGKRFQSEEIYIGHLNRHKSHDKPFKCDVCPKQFHHKTDLRRHVEAIHTGYKAHTCDICNKSFCRKDHLRKHCDTHNKVKISKKPNKTQLNNKINTHSEEIVGNYFEKVCVKTENPDIGDEVAFTDLLI